MTDSDPPGSFPHDVAQARLVAQRLAGPGAPTVPAAVRWLTAIQAQDYASALTSVGLRTRTPRRAEVIAALDAGDIVRSWPMRGTLHLTAAEDLPWMLRLLAPRAVRSSVARRSALALEEPQLERTRELSVEALSGGRRLRRLDLISVWDRAGLDRSGERGTHILRYLAMTGTVVLGPTDGAGEQLVVLLDEWVRSPRHLDRDEALGELALRYFRSHGPATTADLAAWGGLTSRDTRTAVALARPALTTWTVDGTSTCSIRRPPSACPQHAEAAGVLLLPGFDEFLLGYRDRTAQLDPAHADRIVPGGNGIFRPTVVSAGRVVGTWAHTGRGERNSIAAKAFDNFTTHVEEAIPTLYAALP